jgi:butyrate kinase
VLVEVPVHEYITVGQRDEGLFNKQASPNVSVISLTTFMYTNSHTGQEEISHIIQTGTLLCLMGTGNQIWKMVIHQGSIHL